MAYEELKGDIIPFLKLYRSVRVQEGEKLYNKLVNEITKGVTYDAAFSSSTFPSSI
jgi:hypothetical protein